MKKLIRDLYDWTLRLSAHKRATWALAGVSFIESSFFPIPPDAVLIPMCIGNRSRAFWYATVCTVSSVAGGLLGYAIGYFLYESVGTALIEFYGATEKFNELKEKSVEALGWIILAKGLTPFPYKVITIASGFLAFPVPMFIFVSIISRAMRFYLVAALLWKFGAPIQEFIEKRLMTLTVIFLLLIVAGFVALGYL